MSKQSVDNEAYLLEVSAGSVNCGQGIGVVVACRHSRDHIFLSEAWLETHMSDAIICHDSSSFIRLHPTEALGFVEKIPIPIASVDGTVPVASTDRA